eukprot:3928686-Amphidinium_carterae.1
MGRSPSTTKRSPSNESAPCTHPVVAASSEVQRASVIQCSPHHLPSSCRAQTLECQDASRAPETLASSSPCDILGCA